MTSSTGQQTQHVGSVGYDYTVSRPVNTTGSVSCSPGISMNLSLPGSRPPASYCSFTLPASTNNPWPQVYPYSGFPGQAFPGFWPFGGNFGPVATSVVGPQTVTSSLSAPARHVAVSSSCDVFLPAPVPTSSVRPQVNQVSDSESISSDLVSLSTRLSVLENNANRSSSSVISHPQVQDHESEQEDSDEDE